MFWPEIILAEFRNEIILPTDHEQNKILKKKEKTESRERNSDTNMVSVHNITTHKMAKVKAGWLLRTKHWSSC